MVEDAAHDIHEGGEVNEDHIEAIYQSIGHKIQNADELKGRGSFQQLSIYKVPEKLRKLNEGAYTPRVVSIGPIHKDDKRLVDMESQKAIYVHSLFLRIVQKSNQPEADYRQKMKTCVDTMLKMVVHAQSCYAESFEIHEIDFAQMMVVDGCFILEHLYRSLDPDKDSRDPISVNPLVWLDVRHDLLLLENQIPFLVLQKLFLLTVETIQHRPVNLRGSLTEIIIKFFGNMMNFESEKTKTDVTGDHILGLLRNCYLPDSKNNVIQLEANRKNQNKKETEHDKAGLHGDLKANLLNRNKKESDNDEAGFHGDLEDNRENQNKKDGVFEYTATELDLAGVNFYAASKEQTMDMKFSTSCWFPWLCGHKSPPTFCTYDPSSTCCLFSWLFNTFGRTTFSITPICIYDSTESFLRNLIAFEQCSPGIGYHVTSYAKLMDTLIDKENDVEILEKAQVLQNNLGASEDASKLFNNICKEVVMDDKLFSFREQWMQVDKYCSRCWPKNIASLRHKYFTNPWAFIAFIAALYTFGLSIFSLYNTLRDD